MSEALASPFLPQQIETVIAAKTLLVNEQGLLLVLRRSEEDARRPGEWDIPGGGIEFGRDASIKAGAVFEIHQETGLIVSSGSLELCFTDLEIKKRPDQASDLHIVWLGFISTQRITSEQANAIVLKSSKPGEPPEHTEYDWVPPTELPALSGYPRHGRLINHVGRIGILRKHAYDMTRV